LRKKLSRGSHCMVIVGWVVIGKMGSNVQSALPCSHAQIGMPFFSASGTFAPAVNLILPTRCCVPM
jgi:hypothetical protein